MVEIEPSFITGASNNLSHGCVWVHLNNLNSSFLAFALHNLIAIVDISDCQIVCTLSGHTGRVNILCYDLFLIEKNNLCNENSVEIYSGGDDKSIYRWKHCVTDGLTVWDASEKIVEMSNSITAMSVINTSTGKLLCCSDTTGLMIILNCGNDENIFHEIQRIQFSSIQLPYVIHFTKIPTEIKDETIGLLIGSVDTRIQVLIATCEEIFNTSTTNTKFITIGYLTGHEEWTTCISSIKINNSCMMIASGSQDCKVRVWKIISKKATFGTTKFLLEKASFVDDIDDEDDEKDLENDPTYSIVEDEELNSEARIKYDSTDGQMSLAVYFESLLVGHEDWVTAVHWMPYMDTVDSSKIKCKLFTASMDRNMMIWMEDQNSGGIWLPLIRVGDVGGSLGGSVGGNLLGFVGGGVSPTGQTILGIGYGGSFHMWTNIPNPSDSEILSTEEDEGRWYPVPFLTGHFESVNTIAWSTNTSPVKDSHASTGSSIYLLSVSSDQTCRIFANIKPSIRNNLRNRLHRVAGNSDHQLNTQDNNHLWKEISRPQIHGYDLNCIRSFTKHQKQIIVTAGEEKLIRVFEPPGIVVHGLNQLCGIDMYPETTIHDKSTISQTERAYIPELGLSNKGLQSISANESKEQEARGISTLDWNYPPLEGQLSDLTIWPETDKLYGHSNEILCLAISPNGQWIASACKARDATKAQIFLWSAESFQLVMQLGGHESSLVSIEFSPDSRFFASGGKDRTINVYAKSELFQSLKDTLTGPYFLAIATKNAHKRIIWGLSWTGNSKTLVSVSRDGNAKIWSVTDYRVENISKLEMNMIYSFSPFKRYVSITSVAVFTSYSFKIESLRIVTDKDTGEVEESWMVLFGSEEGNISLFKLNILSNNEGGKLEINVEQLSRVQGIFCHGAEVKCIKWSPHIDTTVSSQSQSDLVMINELEFASCSTDHTVRIFTIKFNTQLLSKKCTKDS